MAFTHPETMKKRMTKYHIVHANAHYATRRVRCHETGRYHRHQTHEEEYTLSVCGETLIRDVEPACNISIANPEWNYNWCSDCVNSFPWDDNDRKLWLDKHGIETMDEDSWRQWLRTSEGKSIFPWINLTE